MKKRILSSLCTVAVLAYASLSWGGSVWVENYAENFLMTDVGAGVVLGATASSTADTATVNGVIVGTDLAVGPNAASGLGTIVTGNTMIQGNSTVAEGSPSIAPNAPSPDVYALAAGIVSIDPWANPDHASLQSVASFRQDFTTGSVGNVIIDGQFRHFWQGGASSSTSQWRGVFTVVDVTSGLSLFSSDTGWVNFLAGDNAVNNLSTPFSYALTSAQGGSYAFVADAYINGANPVPEPSTFILAGSGLVGMFLLRRRARKQA